VSASKSTPVSEAETTTPAPVAPADPRWNPAYPRRVHTHERAHWEGVLRAAEGRIAACLPRLTANGPDRPRLDRLRAQMLGARDQIADAARRLPGEVGELYEEDRHRLEEAVAALDRLVKQIS
jgi:hypothetical protein